MNVRTVAYLLDIPDENIANILSYIGDNLTMTSVRSTCKTLKNICDTYGYIRTIKITRSSDFLHKYCVLYPNIEKSLIELQLYGLTNPMKWIPIRWPKRVILYNCKFEFDIIDPVCIADTEDLITYCVYPVVDKINSVKFPRLKVNKNRWISAFESRIHSHSIVD